MAQIKVGDLLFAKTREHGEGRDKFFGHKIVGDTGRSWLVEDSSKFKRLVSKKTMLEANGIQQGMALRWHTQDGMEDQTYLDAHRFRIAKLVEHVGAVQLRAIAAIVLGEDHKL